MSDNKPAIQLLDCTLRDGSYANNFQFSARDTRIICQKLEQAGVMNIEIGHGMGIGASSPQNGVAFENDRDYIKAARESVSKAKLGMFFIPQVGQHDQLKQAQQEGIDFVRIGINATEIEQSMSTVEYALSLDLSVHLNLMKSYAFPAHEIMQGLQAFNGIGLSSVYVVDSAGCMLPNAVSEYVKILSQGDWLVGFHGHNNLDLANANCLAAAAAGASIVDTTLAGMGRSAGNAQTEVMGWLLKQSGYSIEIDQFLLFELIRTYLKPLMLHPQGQDELELIIGMSRFHSAHIPKFKRILGQYEVNLHQLIWKVSAIDCINPSIELIESVALDMSRTDE